MKNKKHHKVTDHDLDVKRRITKDLEMSRLEAEQKRFDAQMKGEQPGLTIRYGLSDIDPLTSEKMFWDLWVKLPQKIRKDSREAKLLKNGINNLWLKIMGGKHNEIFI